MMWRFEFTVLADLTANIFAVCFVIFLVLSGIAAGSARPPVTDLRELFVVVERRPLSGADMVGLLHRHGESASLDLFAGSAVFSNAGRTVRLAPETMDGTLERLLAEADTAGIGLYVFSNALYGAAVAKISALGLPFREISVPAALRARENPSNAWAPAFEALVAERLDRPAFVARLSRLLEGGAQAVPAAGGKSGPDASPWATALILDRLRSWLFSAVALLAPLAGIVTCVWIERRRM